MLATSAFIAPQAEAAGVTVITHGLNGNADGWVTGMADQIPNYTNFPGTTYSFYKVYFIPSGSSYIATWMRLGGSPPTATDSGEIIVAFDWNQMANGNSSNTYQIASVLASLLQNTNFIAEMGGHALAELPLHLVGHSRGGSVMCETSRLLGTNGCWVDHLTTLDPHPLNDPTFPLDRILYSNVDAPAKTYQNVLFHDNYWQNIDSVIRGLSVPGAYIRKLTSLNGGYSSSHSDVHLWYHGTVDERNPASDTEAQLTDTEFGSWYNPYENRGDNAGFKWSLLGGGNRTSLDQPEGVGFPAIRDGYNQNWNLGAGLPQTTNRTVLGSITGLWPNVMRFNLIGTNQVAQGGFAQFSLYFQWAQSATSNATINVYLDDDSNPFNGNGHLIQQATVSATGAAGTSISYWDGVNPLVAALTEANAPVGNYWIYATISGGGKTRYLYAPERLQVLPAVVVAPPVLNIEQAETNVVLSWAANASGFTLLSTTNLNLANSWVTNPPVPAVSGGMLVVTNPVSVEPRFYRLKK